MGVNLKTRLAVCFISVGILSAVSFADSKVAPPISRSQKVAWVTDGFTTTKTGGGPARMLIAGRYIYAGDFAVRAATVSYFKIPNFSPDGKAFTTNDLFKMLSTGIGVKSWGHRTVGNSDVWETHWAHGNRFVRIYAREQADSIEYSLALVRDTYAQEVKPESEIIQKGLFHILPPSQGKSEKVGDLLKFVFGINEAQAQGIPGLPGLPGLPIDPGTLQQITQQLQATMTAVQGVAGEVQGLIPTINQFGANMNSITQNFGQMTGDVNSITKELIPDMHSMTQSLHDYDSIMQKVTSADFIIKSTAEVTATASATQMAMELLFKGGKKLLEVAHVLKDPKNAQEVQLAAEAWKGYQALDEAREKTETLINKRFEALKNLYTNVTYVDKDGKTQHYNLMDNNTNQDLLAFLNGTIRGDESAIQKNLDTANCQDDPNCIAAVAAKNMRLEKDAANKKAMVKAIEATQQSFCYGLNNDIDQVVSYEHLIESSESDILRLEPMKWAADHQSNKTTEENIKDSESNGNISKVTAELDKNIDDVRAAEKNSLIGFRNQAIKNCSNTFSNDGAQGGGPSGDDIGKFCEHYSGFVKQNVVAACVEDYTNQDPNQQIVAAKKRKKSCQSYDDYLKNEKLSVKDIDKFFGKFADSAKARSDFDKISIADAQALQDKIDSNRRAEYTALHAKDDRVNLMKSTQGTEAPDPEVMAERMRSDAQKLGNANRDLSSAQTPGIDGKVLRDKRIQELVAHKADIARYCSNQKKSTTETAPTTQESGTGQK